MNDRRLLFVRAPARGSLVPIFAALAALVLVSLAGLAVAFWPREDKPPVQELREPVRNGTYESGSEQRPARPPQRKPGTWI
jgi:hypothetical protein